MKNRNNVVIGGVFVALGLIFLLGNLNIVRVRFNIFDIGFFISHFWPAMFLIFPGVIMHLTFFSGKNKDAGILVPGGILLVVGLTCQISMLSGWWVNTWPGYILAVAVGLFELYLFGNREKGLLIPVAILGIISLIFFDNFTLNWFFGLRLKSILVSAVLILLGVSIIFRTSFQKRDSEKRSDSNFQSEQSFQVDEEMQEKEDENT